MPRKRKPTPWLSRCCYHVSNTCYEPARVFRFANMRKLAVERLRQLKDRHEIRFLDYLLHTITDLRKAPPPYPSNVTPQEDVPKN